MKELTTQIPLGQESIELSINYIAKLTESSVLVTQGETKILVTIAHVPQKEKRDFFPLSVHYVEKHYATAKIPGGFTRREARPSDREVLTSRLIDRSIRPLFPDSFSEEVQIICTVMSLNPQHQPDILSIIGTSAALNLSSLPFNNVLAAIRVSEGTDGFISNHPPLENNNLDLVVAGLKDSIMMVEAGAQEYTENQMGDALEYAQEQLRPTIESLESWVKEHAQEKIQVTEPDHSSAFSWVQENHQSALNDALKIEAKAARDEAISSIKASVLESLSTQEQFNDHAESFEEIIQNFVRHNMRHMIISQDRRVDGRDSKTVRPITIDTDFFTPGYGPHGGVVFTRGETQAIVTTTLGSERDAQLLDLTVGESKQRFMLHYNFPPFCVGETGMLATKRREIGHGCLARKALLPMLPNDDSFPYTIRIVSEITESNGSSSMATTCGASLSLMLAGVPLRKPIAGVALGLIKEADQCVVLTDILGMEDFLGDMDFKVAGSDTGITALQMDIKIKGISTEILKKALHQAKEGRLHILGLMNEAVPASKDLAIHAPQMRTLTINPAKIKDVIGKGGSVIKSICETYDVTIDITDDGAVKVFGQSRTSLQEAIDHILNITKDIEVGDIMVGKIVKIMEFGAFINLKPGKDGFLHISEIKKERVENINDELEQGQTVTAKVVNIDQQNRIKLTMKDVENIQ